MNKWQIICPIVALLLAAMVFAVVSGRGHRRAFISAASHAAEKEGQKPNAERDLIVFVGERVSVTSQPSEPDSMDEKFEARYRVLKLVFGRYDASNITFTVYDHYGSPRFAKYDTVLMFVSRYEGKLYHEKYQFFPVNPTKDGRWASCGDPYRDEPPVHRGSLRPVPIEFATPVLDEQTQQPCTEGNYVEDLFTVKKDGVLKARGWFD